MEELRRGLRTTATLRSLFLHYMQLASAAANG